jgi:N-acetylmuramoyl-L-alanine amidase
MSRHPIEQRNVVAHSDIAPDRKQDPGELFDWQGLAANGVGLWPGADGVAVEEAVLLPLLGAIGYRTDLPLSVLLTAFQRHWLPGRADGIADEVTRARVAAVARVFE